jgi:hypothetical protein
MTLSVYRWEDVHRYSHIPIHAQKNKGTNDLFIFFIKLFHKGFHIHLGNIIMYINMCCFILWEDLSSLLIENSKL